LIDNDLPCLLFDGQPDIHEPWQHLFSSEAFAFQEGLTQRIELSYQRLRLVNAAVPDPKALARDAAALSALHEWAGVAGAGMATVLSIHYNLFLGGLLEHDHAGRDLDPYVRMEPLGTFLGTERSHGNDAPQLETTAAFDRDTGGFILHTPTPGATKWMPNTSDLGGPKDAVVAARLIINGTDHGVFLFLTPLTNAHGHHLPGVALVEARAHRLAAEELRGVAAKAASPQARFLLQELHVLFALCCIAAHSGELLAHGRLTADQVLQLPDTAEDALAAHVPHVLSLVEAFAVPVPRESVPEAVPT
jgi:alkylation response protein AidB-like acyl-CoA dehydrogenase